jgi:glycosyltransferase involved in cell wall biosynthesis
MNQIQPLVSVILPVCNASVHLPACLESLLKQKHEQIEIIAVDDNSKDASVKILKHYRKLDKRIKVFTNVKRYGLAITLNRAIRQAKGDFVTFMNPHDVNSVWRIKKQLDFLTKNPKVVAVGTQAVSIDEKGNHVEKTQLPIEHEHIYSSFLQGLSVQLETLMINRKRIPSDLLYFAHNTYPFVYIETFVKLFQYGKIANLFQYLYYHRGRPVNASTLTKTKRAFKFIQLTAKSVVAYDYRPSLKTMFNPMLSKVATPSR